jgi:hypothetical protein
MKKKKRIKYLHGPVFVKARLVLVEQVVKVVVVKRVGWACRGGGRVFCLVSVEQVVKVAVVKRVGWTRCGGYKIIGPNDDTRRLGHVSPVVHQWNVETKERKNLPLAQMTIHVIWAT